MLELTEWDRTQKKVSAQKRMKMNSLKSLRAFFGLASWYRKLFPEFASYSTARDTEEKEREVEIEGWAEESCWLSGRLDVHISLTQSYLVEILILLYVSGDIPFSP